MDGGVGVFNVCFAVTDVSGDVSPLVPLEPLTPVDIDIDVLCPMLPLLSAALNVQIARLLFCGLARR